MFFWQAAKEKEEGRKRSEAWGTRLREGGPHHVLKNMPWLTASPPSTGKLPHNYLHGERDNPSSS